MRQGEDPRMSHASPPSSAYRCPTKRKTPKTQDCALSNGRSVIAPAKSRQIIRDALSPGHSEPPSMFLRRNRVLPPRSSSAILLSSRNARPPIRGSSVQLQAVTVLVCEHYDAGLTVWPVRIPLEAPGHLFQVRSLWQTMSRLGHREQLRL